MQPKFVTQKIHPERRNLSTPWSNIQHGGFCFLMLPISANNPTLKVSWNFISDLSLIGSDLPTLLGVATGIAVLAGLICMVLHLFSKTKYPRTRHFADAHSGPPIMFASDTGMGIMTQKDYLVIVCNAAYWVSRECLAYVRDWTGIIEHWRGSIKSIEGGMMQKSLQVFNEL